MGVERAGAARLPCGRAKGSLGCTGLARSTGSLLSFDGDSSYARQRVPSYPHTTRGRDPNGEYLFFPVGSDYDLKDPFQSCLSDPGYSNKTRVLWLLSLLSLIITCK